MLYRSDLCVDIWDGNRGNFNKGTGSVAESQKTVLIVEDNLVNQRVCKRLLDRFGVSSEVANNGKEALDIMARASFDLIIMDCQMPVMDGFATTRAVRADVTGNPHTVIVALTANAMKEDQDACYAAGMNDYLSKPIQMPLLKAMLLKHLTAGQTA